MLAQKHMSLSNDLLRLEGIRRNKFLTGPHLVNVKITNICDYRCKFCFFHAGNQYSGTNPKFMDFRRLEKLIDECALLKTQKLLFSGEGEPFTHPDIYELIDLAHAKGLLPIIHTNCGFRWEKLHVVCKADSMIINHSAASARTHSLIHDPVSGTFEEKIKKLKALALLKKKYGKPDIKIVFVVTSLNFHEIADIYYFCKKLGFGALEFRPFFALPDMKYLMLKDRERKVLLGICEVLLKKGDNYLKRSNLIQLRGLFAGYRSDDYCITSKTGGDSGRIIYRKHPFSGDFKCYLGWYLCSIKLSGKVVLCCHQEHFCIGNIFVSSLEKIWHSRKCIRFARQMKDDFDFRQEKWRRCHDCTNFWLNEHIADKYSLFLRNFHKK